MRILLAGAILATLGLTACSGDGEPAEDAAARLATALETGELAADLFVGDAGAQAQAQYDGITLGLGDTPVEVSVGSVTEEDGKASADLTWSWTLGERAWSYDTAAPLVESGTSWRSTWDPALVEPSLVDGESLRLQRLPARRGDVLGSGGTRLVTDRPVVRFGIDKTQVPAAQAAASARRAAPLLGVSAAPFVRAVRTAGERAFVEAIVLRPADARDVDRSYSRIRGAVALPGTLPLAPTREFAAPILGRVGPVTAELIEESNGRLQVGDVAGLSGLQARYDEQLAGTAGTEIEAVGADGTSRPLFTVDPVDGEPLGTTLDLRLQKRSEQILAAAGARSGASALVAIRPSTGEVLAAANGPGNDGLNAATYGQYAPGSTFKVVTALALLRSGMTPASPVRCPAEVVVDGKAFTNYDDYPTSGLGTISLREAIAFSCNTAFIGARTALRPSALAEAAASLGFGVDHDLGFPAYFGQVPPAASETESAADTIGQGRILASPMAMATVAASVHAGRTVVPHLVDGFAPDPDPDRPLTTPEAASLRGLMQAVVDEGSGSLLAGLPGAVGAKTGTAEYGVPGAGGALPTHAWMIGYRGDLAVAAFVETGDSGSRTAGPLLLRLLS